MAILVALAFARTAWPDRLARTDCTDLKDKFYRIDFLVLRMFLELRAPFSEWLLFKILPHHSFRMTYSPYRVGGLTGQLGKMESTLSFKNKQQGIKKVILSCVIM